MSSKNQVEEYAEKLGNLGDIEKQWAVKALHHAETYENLISAIKGSSLKLTKWDQEIYEAFKETFEMNVDILDPKWFKAEEYKLKWRDFIKLFEKVNEYNFGSLVRIDCTKGYTEENTLFVLRIQFLAVEITRNIEKLNDTYCKKQ
eukprot:NODE_121_length_18880_cov_0.205687.p9 type:complete len:146 gc:universal NODE_121_length_18880_cov_0.205687:11201-10764(-)